MEVSLTVQQAQMVIVAQEFPCMFNLRILQLHLFQTLFTHKVPLG